MALFTATAGAIFFGGTLLGTVGSAALASVIAGALNLMVGMAVAFVASKFLMPDKPSVGESSFGVRQSIQTGGDVPRSIIVGRYLTSGSLCYVNTWGEDGRTPNAYLTMEIAVCDLPVRGLNRIFLGGQYLTLLTDEAHSDGRGFPVEEYRLDGKDHLWFKFYDGTQTAADGFLQSKVSSEDAPYDQNRVGFGVAKVIMTALLNRELFSGMPQPKFEIDGIRLYDPSRDSSVGGAGSQRWNDPSTWGGDGDDLPAVQLYNLFRGVSYEGDWLYGFQNMGAARLPVENWIAQINKCRATVQGADGPETRFLSGGEISLDQPLGDTVEELLSACQGRIVEVGGFYKLHCGEPGEPVAVFTDDDILTTSEQTFTPFFGIAETINAITATYPSPADGWQTVPAPTLRNPAYEAEDGNRRLPTSIDLPFVYRDEQVQRLQTAAMAESRRARRHTFGLPPKFWIYEPGDVISWVSARNGYDEKRFRIDGVLDLPELDVVFDLTEVDPTDYDWDSATQFIAPSHGSISRRLPAPQPIIGWSAQPALVYDDSGLARRPAIELSWDGTMEDVAAVAYEIRLKATGAIVLAGRTDSVERGGIILSHGLLSLTTYEARGRYVPASPRRATWSEWLTVATPDARFGFEDLAEIVAQRIRDAEDAAEAAAASATSALDAAAAAAADALGAADLAGRIRLGLSPTTEDRQAAADTLITGVRDDLDALTGAVSELIARSETIHSGLVEAGFEFDSPAGVARLYGLAKLESDTQTSFQTVEARVDALRAEIELVASVVTSGETDLGAVVQSITDLGLEIDALEGSLVAYATRAELADEQTRITTLETSLDLAEQAITQRATIADLDAERVRITGAEQRLDGIGEISNIVIAAQESTNNTARLSEGLADLAALLAEFHAGNVAQLALAETKISARIDDQGRVIAEQTTLLDALTQTTEARYAEAIRAIADETSARVTATEELRSALTGRLATAETLLETKVDAAGAEVIASQRIAAETVSGTIADALGAITGGSTRTLAQIDTDALVRTTPAEAEAIAAQRISAETTSGVIRDALGAITGGSVRTLAEIETVAFAATTPTEARAYADERITAQTNSGVVDDAIAAAIGALRGGSVRTLAQIENDALARTTPSEAEAVARERIVAEIANGGLIDNRIDALIGSQNLPAIRADISTLKTAKVDANGAIAAVSFFISAASGGALSNLTTLATTTANLKGEAQAAYVLRAKAGGASSDFEMVAWNNATGGGSAIKLNAGLILLDGSVRARHIDVDDLVVGESLTVAPGAIITGNLGNNAVTAFYGGGPVRVEVNPSGSLTTAISFNINRTSEGYDILFLASGFANTPGRWSTASLFIQDSNLATLRGGHQSQDFNQVGYFSLSTLLADGLTGWRRYYLRVRNSFHWCAFGDLMFMALVIKR